MTDDQLEAQLQGLLGPQTQISRVITLALCGGVTLFTAVCLAVSLTCRVAPSGDLSLEQTLTPLALGLNALLWPISFFVSRRLRDQRLPAALRDGVEPALAAERSARIVGLAIREGGALFGLVVVIVGATAGELKPAPWIWLNALPAAAFVVHALATLASPARLRAELRAALALS